MSKPAGRTITADIVVPVYNEEQELEANIKILHDYLKKNTPSGYKVAVVIVDNGSTDETPQIGRKLAKNLSNVEFLRIKRKGRGRALRYAWKRSKAQIVGYMDADLSADLDYLFVLLQAISKDGAHIAIGSRLAQGAEISGRTVMREIMSRGYNLLVKVFFNSKFQDAQCGFKAVKREIFLKLEPVIKNQNWFFDSELLIISSKLNLKITEIPIIWKDDPGSTVKVARTALEDIKGLIRLKLNQPWKNIQKK